MAVAEVTAISSERGASTRRDSATRCMLRRLAAEEVPAMRERLLRYCERDTEATAGILQALRDMVIIQDSG